MVNWARRQVALARSWATAAGWSLARRRRLGALITLDVETRLEVLRGVSEWTCCQMDWSCCTHRIAGHRPGISRPSRVGSRPCVSRWWQPRRACWPPEPTCC